MAIENPSVLYLEQSLSPEQKTAACENIGAVRTIAGKGLSTEDFTTAEKNKLSDVESGAEANVIDEITVNGTAVTPVNKSVEITIPKEIYQATYGVTTYAEIQAAFAAGCLMQCLNAERLATLAYVGTNFYEFNYHRSRAGTVDEMLVYKVESNDTWSTSSRPVVPKFNTTTDGVVPKANGTGDTGKFLKGDGSWDTPTDTTYSVFSTSVDGLVPASDGTGETDKFLKGDGTWDTPTDTTYSGGDGIDISAQDVISVKTDGTTIHAKANGELEVIGGGGGTTYSGGDGIDITGTVVSVDIASSGSGLEFSSNKLKVNGNSSHAIEVGSSGVGIKLATDSGLEFSSGLKVKTDGSTIHVNSSGELVASGGGGGGSYTAGDGIDISAQNEISAKVDGTSITVNASHELTTSAEANVIEGVKLDGAASVLTPDASKNVTIPNAVATGETGATNGLMSADDKKALGTAVQYVENPYDQSSPKNLIAQQMFVVESDQQIIDIVTQQSSLINGKGTLFFRITGV